MIDFQFWQNLDSAFIFLRFVVGAVFIYHAMPKLKHPGDMAQGIGWPVWAVKLLGLVELVAALSIIFGINSKVGALALGIIMLGALYYKIFKWRMPFFSHDKSGWEVDLILLACNLAIFAYSS